jgi:tetratricopeptide (TPR) repeat protein
MTYRTPLLAALLLAAVVIPPAGAAEGEGIRLVPLALPALDGLDTAVVEQITGTADPLRAAQASLGGSLEEPAVPEDRILQGRLGGLYGELGFHLHAYGLALPAEAAYRNAEALVSDAPRWPHLLGLLLATSGRLDDAVAAFERALADDGGANATLEVHLGELHREAGRLDRAREHFGRALDSRTAGAAAHAGLGQVALAEGHAAEAAEHLEAALAAVPGADLLHYPLAMAYRALGDEEAARRHLELRGEVGIRPPDSLVAALEDARTGERVHTLRARHAFRLGRYGEAAVLFRRALEARPETVETRVNLAAALALAGETPAAVEELRTALAAAPDNLTARLNLGLLLRGAGDTDGAILHLRRAAELAPDDLDLQLELAEALLLGGAADEALERFRGAVEGGSQDPRGPVGEARALVLLGRAAEALARLERAHADDPTSGEVAHLLARMLAAGPDLDARDGRRALDLALRVAEALPTPHHATTVALAHAELGDCVAAVAWQEKAVAALAEGTPDREEATRRLERLRQERPCRWPGG